MAELEIKGKKYKFELHLLTFKKFGKEKGLDKISEVADFIGKISVADVNDLSFQQIDDISLLIKMGIEVGEQKVFGDLSIDDVQYALFKNPESIGKVFAEMNESMPQDEVGKPNRSQRRANTKEKSSKN